MTSEDFASNAWQVLLSRCHSAVSDRMERGDVSLQPQQCDLLRTLAYLLKCQDEEVFEQMMSQQLKNLVKTSSFADNLP